MLPRRKHRCQIFGMIGVSQNKGYGMSTLSNDAVMSALIDVFGQSEEVKNWRVHGHVSDDSFILFAKYFFRDEDLARLAPDECIRHLHRCESCSKRFHSIQHEHLSLTNIIGLVLDGSVRRMLPPDRKLHLLSCWKCARSYKMWETSLMPKT